MSDEAVSIEQLRALLVTIHGNHVTEAKRIAGVLGLLGSPSTNASPTSKSTPATTKATASPPKPPPDVASDAELDGQYGDPEIRRQIPPRYWSGEDFVGRTMSQCSPEFLDAFAKYKEACAHANAREGDPAKAKFIEYDKRDARRARGWAARLRRGASAAPTSAGDDVPRGDEYRGADDGDDIPF